MLHIPTENGVRGEVRTEAILADDFWVLERYVDRDGADYLVQRKDIVQDRSSWHLTNLAVIQSKFRENETGQISIKEEYILDKKAEYPDISLHFTSFFVIIHTGNIDNQEIYMLSAKDIDYLWKKDGEKTDCTSQHYVTKKDGHYVFCIRRILAENNEAFILRRGTVSKIKVGMDQIKHTLHLKEITERGISLKVIKAESGYPDFDQEFRELRDRAASVSGFILESLKDTLETLLVNAEFFSGQYKGAKGQLTALEELFTYFKLSFDEWKTISSEVNQQKEDFIKYFEAFLDRYQ